MDGRVKRVFSKQFSEFRHWQSSSNFVPIAVFSVEQLGDALSHCTNKLRMSSVSGLSEPTASHAHWKAHSILCMSGPRFHLHASAQSHKLICIFVNPLCKGFTPVRSDVSDPICSHPSSADRGQSIAKAFASLGPLGDTTWQGLAFQKCLCTETQSCLPFGTGTV